MSDLLTPVFLDRLKRLQLLETALAEQEQFLLGEVPHFFRQFQKKLTKTRKGIEELLPVLVDDPLNRFLMALQKAGESWHFERRTAGGGAGKAGPWEYGGSPEHKVERIYEYLRICKALADAKKPMNIQDLKPFFPKHNSWGVSSTLRASSLETLRDAGLIEPVGEERRPYVFYQLTDEGQKLTEAILAS